MSLLTDLKEALFGNIESSTPDIDSAQLNQITAAALMIEIAIMDNNFDERELSVLGQELTSQFKISSDDINKLIGIAREKNNQATSLYEFTRQINDEFTAQQKFNLITGMWRIAYADGDLDKYEEYMIRKVADLIYVAHGDFIRAKQVALQNN